MAKLEPIEDLDESVIIAINAAFPGRNFILICYDPDGIKPFKIIGDGEEPNLLVEMKQAAEALQDAIRSFA